MLRLDPKQTALDHVREGRPQAGGLSAAARAIIDTPVEPTYSGAVIVGLAQLAEAVVLALLGFAIYRLYVGSQSDFYVPMILLATLVANILFNAARTHTLSSYHTLGRQVGRALACWAAVIVLVSVTAFMLKASDMVSRVWLVSWFGAGALALVLFRLALRALVRQWTADGRLQRRAVIVGGGKDAEMLIEAIRRNGESDIKLLGLFDDRGSERSPETVLGLSKLGKVADLVEFARRTRLDLVIVSMPLSAEKRVIEMLKQLWVLPVDIRLSAHLSQLNFTKGAYSYVGGVPVFDMADKPLSDWDIVFKWVFDKVVALLAIVLLSPVMIGTAIAIKLDSPGPVLFRQKRFGFNNELIEVFKFRSMYVDNADVNAARLVTRGDPRVTRVGRFIRKTSIDELPQFFNVLLGQLSVVGPRPHALQAKAANLLYDEAVDGYFARHRVKPGVTGWAQVNGWRGETDTVDKIMHRVHHDLYYIENWSLLFDARILFMTPLSLLAKNENAY